MILKGKSYLGEWGKKIGQWLLTGLLYSFFVLQAYTETPSLRFEHLSVEKGLSQNSVHCIIQDKKGFMWFGTDVGLNRYDGYSFVIFKHDIKNPRSITNNYINTLYNDKSGKLWVGTRGGINVYDEKTKSFTNLRSEPGNRNTISDDNVNAILEDRYGKFWFGTANGLDEYDPKINTFNHYIYDTTSVTLSNNFVTTLLEDRQGILWVGTRTGLNRFVRETHTFIRYRSASVHGQKNKLLGDEISSLYEDRRGTLWIGTMGGGFNLYNRQSEIFKPYTGGNIDGLHIYNLEDDFIHGIYEDHLGVFWIGSEKGLVQFNREKEWGTVIKNDDASPEGLNDVFITCAYEDRSLNLWFGTNSGGVNKLDRTTKKFTHIKSKKQRTGELLSNNIQTFYIDKTGTFWVGTWLGSMSRFDPKTNAFINYPRNIPDFETTITSTIVYSMFEDDENNFWIGTAWGLSRLHRGTTLFDHYYPWEIDFSIDKLSPPNYAFPNNIYSLVQGGKDEILLATNNGLFSFHYKTRTWKRWKHDPNDPTSLSKDYVTLLFRDSKGKLWLGTNGGGLDLFDTATQKFTHYFHDASNDSSISSDVIYSINESSNGTMWIGTTEGLNQFFPEQKKFIHYTENDGLPDNVVQSILEDNAGNLWLGTNHGLSKFNPNSGVFRNYLPSDGIQGYQYNNHAALKSKTGQLYFGGENGYDIFYPDSIQDNPLIVPVVLTSFHKFNHEIQLDTDITVAKSVKLNYNENVISIEFASLDYSHPQNNGYMYKLEGFDANWVKEKARRIVTYTNLDPGEYLFRVKGTNSDGLWNNEETTIGIIIIPPFWATWWFRICVLIILVVGIEEVIRYIETRKYREKIRKLERERALENERTRISRDMHDEVGSSLTRISILSELGMKKGGEASHEQLQQIYSTSQEVIDSMREIIWTINPKNDTLENFAEYLHEYVGDYFDPTPIEVQFDIPEQLPEDFVSGELRHHFLLVVKEAIHNITKHANATKVVFSLNFSNSMLEVGISDNGIGMNMKNNPKFTNGLISMNKRMAKINGKCDILSEEGKGTKVVATVNISQIKRTAGIHEMDG